MSVLPEPDCLMPGWFIAGSLAPGCVTFGWFKPGWFLPGWSMTCLAADGLVNNWLACKSLDRQDLWTTMLW